jgi:hypothetical protein
MMGGSHGSIRLNSTARCVDARLPRRHSGVSGLSSYATITHAIVGGLHGVLWGIMLESAQQASYAEVLRDGVGVRLSMGLRSVGRGARGRPPIDDDELSEAALRNCCQDALAQFVLDQCLVIEVTDPARERELE